MRLRRILVAVDFSAPSMAALRWAIAFAAPLGAGVVALHVVGPVGYLTPLGGRAPAREFPALAEAKRAAAAALERLGRDAGPGVATELRVGDPREEIVRAAVELGADLLVVGTEGRSGVRRFLLGSVAERVVRTATVPVVTIRASGGRARAPRAESAGGS